MTGTYIDPADEYEAAAEYVARRYGRPIGPDVMRALLLVPERVLESIECDPDAWRQRVHEYLRGMNA